MFQKHAWEYDEARRVEQLGLPTTSCDVLGIHNQFIAI